MADRERVKKGLDLCLTGEPSTCKDCPYDAECKEARGIGPSPLRRDALELLKEQQETIASLQGTICKLNAALAEQPKQKFFVDSNGKITPLPIQKHGHWISVPDKSPEITTINMYSFICSCSECGKAVGHHAEYNYCPGCGAMMNEVNQNES